MANQHPGPVHSSTHIPLHLMQVIWALCLLHESFNSYYQDHRIVLCKFSQQCYSFLDDIIEQKSGSSTPQRSGSAAGLHRPRLSIDSATVAMDIPPLSSSLPCSLPGNMPMLAPRQGSHTMDFFEMCASLITTLAR